MLLPRPLLPPPQTDRICNLPMVDYSMVDPSLTGPFTEKSSFNSWKIASHLPCMRFEICAAGPPQDPLLQTLGTCGFRVLVQYCTTAEYSYP